MKKKLASILNSISKKIYTEPVPPEEPKKTTVSIPFFEDGLLQLREDDTIEEFSLYCSVLHQHEEEVTRVLIPRKAYENIYQHLYIAGTIKTVEGQSADAYPFIDGIQSLIALHHPTTGKPVRVFTINPSHKIH